MTEGTDQPTQLFPDPVISEVSTPDSKIAAVRAEVEEDIKLLTARILGPRGPSAELSQDDKDMVRALRKTHAQPDPATQKAQARPSIVQVEAAKLRLVTDRRLGKESPEWLERVAKGLPAQPEGSASHAMTATD